MFGNVECAVGPLTIPAATPATDVDEEVIFEVCASADGDTGGAVLAGPGWAVGGGGVTDHESAVSVNECDK